jgi:myo-inositol-1(or 4)-monophosphatase
MDTIVAVAEQAAKAAGKRLRERFGQAEVYQKGGSHNLVTQADYESEQLITELIREAFPEHRFLLEEGPSTGVAADDHLWIVDPLDATNNFAHGIPHYSVSIAYAEKGTVKAGVVLDPNRDELFHAVLGVGAFLNGQPIRVGAARGLEEAIVATGFYYDRGELMRRTLAAIETLFSRNMRGMRRMGSAAIDLAWVACGRFDAFFEYQLAPWDYGAGKLIIEEAGGRCSDRTGQPLEIESGHIIATNPHLFEALLDAVKWPVP